MELALCDMELSVDPCVLLVLSLGAVVSLALLVILLRGRDRVLVCCYRLLPTLTLVTVVDREEEGREERGEERRDNWRWTCQLDIY